MAKRLLPFRLKFSLLSKDSSKTNPEDSSKSIAAETSAKASKADGELFSLRSEGAGWVALALGAVGLILRLVGLGSRPFWFDEVISVVYARQDWAGLVALNAGDNHPVGYYAALKLWLGLLGESEAAVRLLSVGPGVAAIGLVWLIGRHLFPGGPRPTLVTVALTALSPFQIYFSQEARNYSWLEFWVLAAVWFWLRALDKNQWRDWVGLGLCGGLGLLCNLTTAFYLAALGLYPLWQARRFWQNGVLLRLCLTGAGAGLVSGLALWPKLTSRLDTIKNNFWIPQPDPLLILRTFYTFIFGASAADKLLPAFALALLILILTLAAVLPACYRQLRQGQDAGLLKCAWLLFGPILLIISVSLLFQSLYLDKALIGCAPFYYLLIGWSIFRPDATSRTARGRGSIAAIPLVAAILLALAALPDLYTGTIAPSYIARYDARRINAYLSQQARPGDVVLTASDIAWLPLAYYGPNDFPPKYPIREYPYPNVFPLLLQKMGSRFVGRDEVSLQPQPSRFWVVFEVNPPGTSLSEPPHPADLAGEVGWFHSASWQRELLAYYDQHYRRLEAIALDRVILVLWEPR